MNTPEDYIRKYMMEKYFPYTQGITIESYAVEFNSAPCAMIKINLPSTIKKCIPFENLNELKLEIESRNNIITHNIEWTTTGFLFIFYILK
jgi:hypothetical protein